VIGYIDGTIEIVDIHGHLQAYFGNFGNEPVSQLKTNASSLVLLSGSKQFILSYC
jgi:phosphatidate phosphatase PAH1